MTVPCRTRTQTGVRDGPRGSTGYANDPRRISQRGRVALRAGGCIASGRSLLVRLWLVFRPDVLAPLAPQEDCGPSINEHRRTPVAAERTLGVGHNGRRQRHGVPSGALMPPSGLHARCRTRSSAHQCGTYRSFGNRSKDLSVRRLSHSSLVGVVINRSICSGSQRMKSFLTEATVHLVAAPSPGYHSRSRSPVVTKEVLLDCAEIPDTA